MSIEVISNRANVEKAVGKSMKKAAIMIGGTVEGHAKDACPVDTGLLRNSITYALGGQPTNIVAYTDDSGEQKGQYDGTAPRDDDGELTIYVGTNVQYAPYQELGAPNINLTARPYLRPAMENFQSEIEQIIRLCFDNMG